LRNHGRAGLSRKKNDGSYPFRAIREVLRIFREFAERDIDLISWPAFRPLPRARRMLAAQWQLYNERTGFAEACSICALTERRSSERFPMNSSTSRNENGLTIIAMQPPLFIHPRSSALLSLRSMGSAIRPFAEASA